MLKKDAQTLLLQLCKTSVQGRRDEETEENIGKGTVCCGIGRTVCTLARKYRN